MIPIMNNHTPSENGSFQFTFPDTFLDDTLIFSCLGYALKKVPIKSILSSKPILIPLSIKAILLPELVVKSDKNQFNYAISVLEKVLNNIEQNYLLDPYELLININKEYVDFSTLKHIRVEGEAITYFDSGYRKKSRGKNSFRLQKWCNYEYDSTTHEWNPLKVKMKYNYNIL